MFNLVSFNVVFDGFDGIYAVYLDFFWGEFYLVFAVRLGRLDYCFQFVVLVD